MAWYVILTSPTVLGGVAQGPWQLGPFKTSAEAVAASNAATRPNRAGPIAYNLPQIIGSDDPPEDGTKVPDWD